MKAGDTQLKYDIGDIVKIRSDLCEGELYGNWVVIGYMEEFAGTEARIEEVEADCYHLEGIECRWTDEMFSGLVEPKYFDADFDAVDVDAFGLLYGGAR